MGLKVEQELKAKYLLATMEFDGMQIVKLTTDNVARVEAMIMTDSGYTKTGDINACPTHKKECWGRLFRFHCILDEPTKEYHWKKYNNWFKVNH